jgi:hypothetical protein
MITIYIFFSVKKKSTVVLMEPLRQSQVPRPRPTAKNVPKDPLALAVVPEIASGLEGSVSRQSRVTRPTAKLIDGNNHAKPALTFQRAAVAAEIARVATDEASASPPSPSTPSSQPTVVSSFPSAPSREPSLSASNLTPDECSPVIQSKNKRRTILSSDEDEPEPEVDKAPKKKKMTRKSICKY